MNLKKSFHILLKKICAIKKSDQCGFSLTELMVVVGIIAMMAAIGLPSVLNYLPSIRLRTAARELYTDMQRAKMEAVKTNRPFSITFVNGTGTPCKGGSYLVQYTDANSNVINFANVTIQNDVCLTATPLIGIGFDTDGTPNGGMLSVTLTHGDAVSTYKISQSIAGQIIIDN